MNVIQKKHKARVRGQPLYDVLFDSIALGTIKKEGRSISLIRQRQANAHVRIHHDGNKHRAPLMHLSLWIDSILSISGFCLYSPTSELAYPT